MRRLHYIAYLYLLPACTVPHESLINFNQGPNFPSHPVVIPDSPSLIIQSDDILLISVHALNIGVTAPYNLGSNDQDETQAIVPGEYLVKKDGNITYPGLGEINVSGNTIDNIIQIFNEKLASYLNDPIVRIQLKNIRFTVIGEVAQAAQFTVEQEKTTILEALGMARDITPYGDRTDILVIREQNGLRSFGHMNLQSREVFDSPFFYLQQNDVIYVKPIEQKRATVRDQSQNIVPWVSAFVSFATLLVTLLR